MGHAIFAPSSLDYLAACPARWSRTKDLPRGDSQASIDGTRRHALLSWRVYDMLGAGVDSKTPWPTTIPNDRDPGRPWQIDSQDVDMVKQILPYIKSHPAWTDPAGRVYSEERVEISKWLKMDPGLCWGTADLVFLTRDVLEVVDAKFGRVPVNPDRYQLKAYAFGGGALANWSPQAGLHAQIKTVRLTIAQPLDSTCIKQVDFHLDAMAKWGPEIGKIITRAQAPDAEAIPGEQCRYCEAKPTCPEYQAMARAAAAEVFAPTGARTAPVNMFEAEAEEPEEKVSGGLPGLATVDEISELANEKMSQDPESLSSDELGRILDQAMVVEAWFKGLRKEAEKRLKEREPVSGWKLVAGRRSREYVAKNEAETVDQLRQVGFRVSDIWKKTVVSCAEAERICKTAYPKKLGKFNSIWRWKQGGPQLAPEGDPSPAWGEEMFTPEPEPPEASPATDYDWM